MRIHECNSKEYSCAICVLLGLTSQLDIDTAPTRAPNINEPSNAYSQHPGQLTYTSVSLPAIV